MATIRIKIKGFALSGTGERSPIPRQLPPLPVMISAWWIGW